MKRQPLLVLIVILLTALSLVYTALGQDTATSTPPPQSTSEPLVLTPIPAGYSGAWVPDPGKEVTIALYNTDGDLVALVKAKGPIVWDEQGRLLSGADAFSEIQTSAQPDKWYEIVDSELQDGLLSITTEAGVFSLLPGATSPRPSSRPVTDARLNADGNLEGQASYFITGFGSGYAAFIYQDVRNYNIHGAGEPEPVVTPVDSTDAIQAVVRSGDDGSLMIGKLTMMMGAFGFDPATRETGPAGGGLVVTMEDSPVPVVMSFGHGFSGSAYAEYANVILDVTELADRSDRPIGIALQYTTDGVQQCFIRLNVGGHEAVFISKDYLVFPDDLRTLDAGGPYVTLVFQLPSNPDGTLVVTRNDQEINRTDLAGKQEVRLQLAKTLTTNDVIKWRVEGARDQGTFGFPMNGATPDLVEYHIQIGGSR